jgi:DNA (cytosine-5)-methyltransferase 1
VTAYYNEIDPFAAAWLRELIKAGHIAPGDVDERSITDVRATDLVGYRQVHFFAGIGGWSLAARLAGIPDDFPLWTGSAPCQPFSAAGRQRGTDDERHLWPVMRDLVAECRPPVVAGEQVASRLGLDWLAAVRADLEAEGYGVGAVDLCAASIGAPHVRQRLFWGGLADPGRERVERRAELGVEPGAEGPPESEARQQQRGRADVGSGSNGYGLADAVDARRERRAGQPIDSDQRLSKPSGLDGERTRPPDLGWSDPDWLFCRDERWRPVESGTFPLADGVPARVGRLRGYGNAIVPQVAAAFLTALIGGDE